MTKIVGCSCGCGQPAPLAQRSNARLGHEKGKPLMFISGHNKRNTTDLTRYQILENGCWLWLGSKSRKGYGRAQVSGEHTGAHRAIYEAKHGSLPRNVHLDHVCRNTSCVNPAHLEPKSPSENSAITSRTRLSKEKADLILGSTMTSATLARQFGVSRQAVSDVRSGRTWTATE
jgi:HNH endonuclease